MNALERQYQNRLDDIAAAQSQMAEGIYQDLLQYGEACYHNKEGELLTVTFEDLFESFEEDLEPFLKTVFMGSAHNKSNVILLKGRMEQKARELAIFLTQETFS